MEREDSEPVQDWARVQGLVAVMALARELEMAQDAGWGKEEAGHKHMTHLHHK